MTLNDPEGVKSSNSNIKSIKRSVEKKDFTNRFLVTIGAVVAYSLLTIVPLSGANLGVGDPLASIRIITASMQGSLAELGILPLLTAGLITYTLVGMKLLKVDPTNQKELNQYNLVRLLLSILLTIILALFITLSGHYGPDLEFSSQALILIQLIVAGVLIVILNEIINRGWGFGSGISLFLAGTIGLRIFQAFLAPNNILEGPNNVTSARGLLFAFLYWVGEEGPIAAVGNLFFRYSSDPAHQLYLPSLSILSVILAGVFFILVTYFQPRRSKMDAYEVLKSSKKVSFTPMIPLVLTATIFALVNFASFLVWNSSGRENTTSVLTWLLGTFRLDTASEQYVPTGGLVYFITSPQSLIANLFTDPISAIFQAIIYGAIFLGVYLSFTRITFQIAGLITHIPQEKEFLNQWLLIGIISVIVDLFNPLALGFGVVLLALILMSYSFLLEGVELPEFVRFDFLPSDKQEIRIDEDKRITRRKFSLIIILIGLGLFFLRFIVFVILGQQL